MVSRACSILLKKFIILVTIGVVVVVMCQLAGINAFQIIAQFNAPTPNPGGGLPPTNPWTQSSTSHLEPGRRSTALQAYGPSHYI